MREVFANVPTTNLWLLFHNKLQEQVPEGVGSRPPLNIPPGTDFSSPLGVAIHAMRYNEEVCNAAMFINIRFVITKLANTLPVAWSAIVAFTLDGGYAFPCVLFHPQAGDNYNVVLLSTRAP